MSQLLRLDGFMKDFGMNEVKVSVLLKDIGIQCIEKDGRRYVDFDDFMALIRVRTIKLKQDAEELRPVNSAENGEELFNIKEACSFMKISRTTLHRFRSEGKIETIYFGHSPRFRKKDLLGLAA